MATAIIAASILLCTFQIAIAGSAADGESEKVFTIGMKNDVSTLNPFAAIEDNEYIIMDFIYDYLFFPSVYDDTWPSLVKSGWFMDGPTAASQEVPSDFSSLKCDDPADWPMGSIWEYNLTENVFWNDGEPLTAEDVEFTIGIQIGPNYMTYWAFQPTTRWINHVEAVNDLKFRIFFTEFDSEEPYPVAFGAEIMIPVMPKHLFENEPTTYMAYTWNGIPTIGTGPFMGTDNLQDELLAGEICTLIPNPYFNFEDEDGIRKGFGAAYNVSSEIDKVRVKFFSEETTLQIAVKRGDIDFSEISANTYVTWLQDTSLPEDLHLVSTLSSWQFSREVSWNAYADAPGTVNPLRLDPAVLRASALATNKSQLIDIVYKGLGVEGVGLISPYAEDWWWEPGDEIAYFNLTDGNGDIIPEGSYQKPIKDVMGYDIDLANKILDEAGYVWTGTPYESVRKAGPLVGARMQNLFGIPVEEIENRTLDFDVVVVAGPYADQQIFEVLYQQWSEVGIELAENLVNAAIWSQLVYGYTFEITITYWSGDYDPNYLCFIPTSFALFGWNEFGTGDEVYDNLYLKQVSNFNYTERKHWSDECIKWQYQSGSINTLVYPLVCHAHSEKRWTNWLEEEEIYSYFQLEWRADQEDDDLAGTYLFLTVAVAILAAAVISIVLLKQARMRKEYDLSKTDEDEEPDKP